MPDPALPAAALETPGLSTVQTPGARDFARYLLTAPAPQPGPVVIAQAPPTPPVAAAPEVVRARTVLTPQDEQVFRVWYRNMALRAGLDPDPDHPLHRYDYRGAWRAGAVPMPDPTDEYRLHWPSQFKDPDHPTRFKDGVDTITGQPVK